MMKWNNWRITEDRRITIIALNIAADPTQTSNKEDLSMSVHVMT